VDVETFYFVFPYSHALPCSHPLFFSSQYCLTEAPEPIAPWTTFCYMDDSRNYWFFFVLPQGTNTRPTSAPSFLHSQSPLVLYFLACSPTPSPPPGCFCRTLGMLYQFATTNPSTPPTPTSFVRFQSLRVAVFFSLNATAVTQTIFFSQERPPTS